MGKKIKKYDEAELIKLFKLTRLAGNDSGLLIEEWTSNPVVSLLDWEEQLLHTITKDLLSQIVGWNEEMLKMNFIAFILLLGNLSETKKYKTYYESTLEGVIDGHLLKVKADMMIATGILERAETPYFYFQEYKKFKDPKGDVTAQLLEAFLIAQDKNKNGKPLYGCTILGREWEFYIMQDRTYYVSRAYNCTNKDDLIQIISILRKFRHILDTKLLDE